MIRRLLITAPLLLLAACASTVPSTIISQPTSVRPVSQPQMLASNGSIYQAATARTLFEDQLARRIGDNITVLIQEQVSATSKSGISAERKTDNSTKVAAGANSRFFNGTLGGLNLGVTSDNKHDGKGEASSSNTFNGQITATVVDVLPNGNLSIAGEKQVNIRGEISYLRVSGLVNPSDVRAGNVVSSTRIAEARIEEMGTGTIASADRAGWLQRFFYSFLPF